MGKQKKSESRHSILASAKILFWKYGIRKVTVDEICKEAGVSKMTFYRQFENKLDLAKNVLEEVFKNSLNQYDEIINRDIPYPDKIKEIVLLKHEGAKELSEEFLKDLYQNESFGLKAYFEDYRQTIYLKVMADLKDAQEKGWIRADLKLEFVLYMLNSLNEKMTDPNFLSIYDSTQEAVVELTKFFFYGILDTGK